MEKGRIEIRVFSSEALNRINSMNLEEQFDLPLPKGFSLRGNKLVYDEIMCSFDAEGIVKAIAEALKEEGTVSATYEYKEEGSEAYTYYYLGEYVKVVYFCGTNDDGKNVDLEDAIGYYRAQHAALLHFNSDELREIYRDVMEEDEVPTDIESDDQLIEVILEEMHQGVNEMGSEFFATPILKKVMKQIKTNLKVCRFESHDFTPNLNWQSKGIVQFTKKEIEFLTNKTPIDVYGIMQADNCEKLGEYNRELENERKEYAKEYLARMEKACKEGKSLHDMIEASRKTVAANVWEDRDAFEVAIKNLDQDAIVSFTGKHFVLTGFYFCEQDVIAEIEKRGGIFHDGMVKKADYLVVCLESPGAAKVKKALEWRQKGASTLIVSDYQMWQAIFG